MACQIYMNTSSRCMNANMSSFSHISVSSSLCVDLVRYLAVLNLATWKQLSIHFVCDATGVLLG